MMQASINESNPASSMNWRTSGEDDPGCIHTRSCPSCFASASTRSDTWGGTTKFTMVGRSGRSVSDEYAGLDAGRRSLPVLYDTDRDGDLDLVVGSESDGIHLYRNDGTREVPDFVDAGPFELPDYGFAAPAFVDLDGDGDDDVLLGGTTGGLWYFENRGR